MGLTNVKNVHSLITGFVEGQNYSPKINRIGVTTLIGPPLVRQLRFRFHKHLISDVSEYLWAFFGTSFHKAMETNKIPGWVYEVKRSLVKAIQTLWVTWMRTITRPKS